MKSMKRMGLWTLVVLAAAVVVLVIFVAKFTVKDPNKKGFDAYSLRKVGTTGEGRLFPSWHATDIREIQITVREVDYDAEEADEEVDEEAEEPVEADDEDADTESAAGTEDAEETGEEPAEAEEEAEEEDDPAPEVIERKITLARLGKQWMVTRPFHGLANYDAAEAIARSVAELKVQGTYADETTLDKKYGLHNPSLTCRARTKKGDEVEVLFGKDTAIGSEVYVAVLGRGGVSHASSSAKSSLTKDADDLREKKVAEFEPKEAKRVVLDHGGTRIVMEQIGKKDEANWWLTQPVQDEADHQKCGDLVSALSKLEAKDFEDAVDSLAAFGLDEPQLTARIDFGGKDDDIVIKLGKETSRLKEDTYSSGDGEEEMETLIYCMTEDRDEVFLVDAGILDDVAKEPIDLRQRNIIDFSVLATTKVIIKRAGEDSIELEKEGTEWKITAPTEVAADGAKVDNFLWALQDIEAEDFLEDQEVAVSKVGLGTSPRLKVTIVEEPDDGPAKTHTLSFGDEEADGTRYYCQASDKAKPLLVNDSFNDDIPTSADDFLESEDEEDDVYEPDLSDFLEGNDFGDADEE